MAESREEYLERISRQTGLFGEVSALEFAKAEADRYALAHDEPVVDVEGEYAHPQLEENPVTTASTIVDQGVPEGAREVVETFAIPVIEVGIRGDQDDYEEVEPEVVEEPVVEAPVEVEPAAEPVEELTVEETPTEEPVTEEAPAEEAPAEEAPVEVEVKPTKAADVVAAIEEALTLDRVEWLAEGDARATVVAAADKRRGELTIV